MNIVAIAWRYLLARPLAAGLNLLLVSTQLDRAFERDLAGRWLRTRSFARWWCRRGRPRMRKRQALPHPASSAKPRPPKLGPNASAGHGCSSGCSIDIGMQRCPNCGAGELKIIAAILERPVIEKILAHLGLDPPPPPPKGRAREAGPHVAGYAACAVGHLSPRAAATLQPPVALRAVSANPGQHQGQP